MNMIKLCKKYDLQEIPVCWRNVKTRSVLEHALKYKVFSKILRFFVVLEVFCEQGVLKNFAKFTGKHLC